MEVWQSSFIEGCFYQGQGSEAGDYHLILHDPTFALATCWPAVRDVCSTCRCSPKRPAPRGTALGKTTRHNGFRKPFNKRGGLRKARRV